MTDRQLREAIKTTLGLAEVELSMARESTTLEKQATWIACMTASKIFSGLAAILINIRELESRNGPTEKNISEL